MGDVRRLYTVWLYEALALPLYTAHVGPTDTYGSRAYPCLRSLRGQSCTSVRTLELTHLFPWLHHDKQGRECMGTKVD